MDQRFLFNHQSLKEKNKQKHEGGKKEYSTNANQKKAKLKPVQKSKYKNMDFEESWYA